MEKDTDFCEIIDAAVKKSNSRAMAAVFLAALATSGAMIACIPSMHGLFSIVTGEDISKSSSRISTDGRYSCASCDITAEYADSSEGFDVVLTFIGRTKLPCTFDASDVEIFVTVPERTDLSKRCIIEDMGTSFIIPGSETIVNIHSTDDISEDNSVIVASVDIPHSSNRERVEFLLNMQ